MLTGFAFSPLPGVTSSPLIVVSYCGEGMEELKCAKISSGEGGPRTQKWMSNLIGNRIHITIEWEHRSPYCHMLIVLKPTHWLTRYH